VKKFKDTDMQLLLGQVLRAGTVLSICVVFFGGIIYLAKHGQSIPNYREFKGIPDFVSNAKGLFNGALTFKGQAIIQLGIILLIATPIMRVIFSTIGFALEKDYMYVVISLLVLCIICFSMINGHAG
jgi:uncharacterized membrane protein